MSISGEEGCVITAIFDWVKGLVYFYILMTAVCHVLPKSSYEKYVRFFCGLLLVILLVTPILELLSQGDVLLERVSYESFWQEMNTLELDAQGLEETQKEAWRIHYQEAIGQDVAGMAVQHELQVLQASVTLTEAYTIDSMELWVAMTGENGISVEKVDLGQGTPEYPQILAFQQQLQTFYQISQEQIQIIVEG